MRRIPLVDLQRQHELIEASITAEWKRITSESDYILGKSVLEFESAFASYCEVAFCTGVASGTDALELALRALGIGRGDSVVVPANSFIASALSVLRAGADVVLVDNDPHSYLIGPEQIEAKFSRRVKAIMPVHLYGQVAPVERISKSFTVPIVEDAAQSHGARRLGRRAGSLGTVGATSFYPGKNLGAYGDGGAVVTDHPDIASRVRTLRNWGSDEKYHHPEVGFNSRLDSMQAAVLVVKLRYLEEWNRQRREAAQCYETLLSRREAIHLPITLDGNEHVWHLYVVRVENRDQVLSRLHEQGVEAGIHYPIPMHLQGALATLGHRRGDFPVAEMTADTCLSLPIFPGITESEQEQVAEALLAAV